MQTLKSQWDRDPLTVEDCIPTSMLHFKLGRTHVGTPMREVLREVHDAIKRAPNQEAWTREVRRQTLAAAAWMHLENRAEYARVVSGTF